MVSSSGFFQSRQKIKEDAFKQLLKYVNKAFPCNNTYKGYRLLAVDGSDLTIPTDPYDYETYETYSSKQKGFNNIHINALYDILNNRYLDMILQPTRLENERQAMITMAEAYQGEKAIFIADRGYESYNLYEHIRHTNNYFLIRIKDGSSRLFRNLPKRSEYDKEIEITFTRNQTNKAKENYDKNIWLAHNQRFDYLSSTRDTYQTSYRVVRIRNNGLKDKYETLITNLPKETISTEDIKELYRLRWDIEISFRHLKYSVNLNSLHSKRRDFIKQEIWAKLIMFNISMIIIDYIQKNKLSKINKRKYEYKINIANAMYLIIKSIRKGGIPPNLIDLIAKELLPIRPNRTYKRNTKPHSFVSFGYRYK